MILNIKICNNKPPHLPNLGCICVCIGCTQTSVLIPHDLESNHLVLCTSHGAAGPFRVRSACWLISLCCNDSLRMAPRCRIMYELICVINGVLHSAYVGLYVNSSLGVS
jgi:hypothetical protein